MINRSLTRQLTPNYHRFTLISPSSLPSIRLLSSTSPPLPRSPTTLNTATPYNLIYLRHGQSTWNRDNRFIGWTDTPLTSDGVLEARVAGKILKDSGVQIDVVHTSMLRRR